MSDPWIVAEVEGLTLIHCTALQRVAGVAHGFSTRRADGVDEFDLGPAETQDREILRRRGRFLRAAGLEGSRAGVLRQVHGAKVALPSTWGRPPEGDAALWLLQDGPLVIPSVRSADCVPILLADRDGRGAAAVHAGWRGTAAGVAQAAIQALEERGIRAGGLLAALGPAALACCYQVGADVSAAVQARSGGSGAARAGRDGRILLDLHEANRRQLVAAGVPPSSIHLAPWCTVCRGDLFFSHRREGSRAGRMMSSIGTAAAGCP